MSIWFTIGWIIIIVAALALETAALLRKKRGDTFSEHAWALLRKSPVIWFTLLGLLIWLVIHLFGFGIVDNWIGSW